MGLLDKAAEKKSEPKVVEVAKPKRQRRERKVNTEIEPEVVSSEPKKTKKSKKSKSTQSTKSHPRGI